MNVNTQDASLRRLTSHDKVSPVTDDSIKQFLSDNAGSCNDDFEFGRERNSRSEVNGVRFSSYLRENFVTTGDTKQLDTHALNQLLLSEPSPLTSKDIDEDE